LPLPFVKTRTRIPALHNMLTIDVYQTARTNGFFIEPLSDKKQTQNIYCLMLVD